MRDSEPKLPKRLTKKANEYAGKKELTFKRLVRNTWQDAGGKVDAVEPSFGSSLGLADLFFVHDGKIVPVELKVGEYDPATGFVFPNAIRSDQIKWHKEMRELNVGTGLFVDCGKVVVILFGLNMSKLEGWKYGIETNDQFCSTVILKKDFKAKSIAKALGNVLAY